ncbi:MAG: hypothetical protein JXP73_18835 [Deltaproteobacteria bacterium]|nr:hypothetical protein [Deltaproteobacteria bacterium]
MMGGPLGFFLLAASALAAPAEVSALLSRLGDADLVVMNNPQTARPVRVLLATRVAARPRVVRRIVTSPASYGEAMPSFRRVDLLARRKGQSGQTDLEVAWELDVPLWNLEGKLWLRPRRDGADLELAEGDFAPGLFHVSVRGEQAGKRERAILTIEGHANVRDANLATRQLVQRSALAEPAMTVAAAYVMLKSLARLAEEGAPGRPRAAMSSAEPSTLDGTRTGAAVPACLPAAALLAAVRSKPDGRLARVEVALPLSLAGTKAAAAVHSPETFRALPGWKKVATVTAEPKVCTDPLAPCWAVENDLPLFSLDGIWKVRQRPWRARMVAGERQGALMGIDLVPSPSPGSSMMVLSEHPRLDRAGYAARKLIAAEPYLEHGLALALTLVEATSLQRAFEASANIR